MVFFHGEPSWLSKKDQKTKQARGGRRGGDQIILTNANMKVINCAVSALLAAPSAWASEESQHLLRGSGETPPIEAIVAGETTRVAGSSDPAAARCREWIAKNGGKTCLEMSPGLFESAGGFAACDTCGGALPYTCDEGTQLCCPKASGTEKTKIMTGGPMKTCTQGETFNPDPAAVCKEMLAEHGDVCIVSPDLFESVGGFAGCDMCGGALPYTCDNGDQLCCPQATGTEETKIITDGKISWSCSRGETFLPGPPEGGGDYAVGNTRDRRDPGFACREAIEKSGGKVCNWPAKLVREYGLVEGCGMCGDVTPYQCDDGKGLCCPGDTRDSSIHIKGPGIDTKCFKVEAGGVGAEAGAVDSYLIAA